ncbi:MAG: cytidylate kinase-like family protein [Myxococcota bacterium]|nr:cytidylate kinase-like family protein [Myxococcota bacterium]
MKTRDEALRTLLLANLRERRGAVVEVARRGELPFVTISRQAGAGGRSLASAILAEFERHPGEPLLQGWSSFDQELCEMVATDPELNVSLTELVTEEYRTPAEDYVSVLLGKSFQDEIQKKISVSIRELALVGKAIVVGRGGVCITGDIGPGIHIRLVAPREVRVERMMESFAASEKEAGTWVDEQDRSRAKMMKSRFGRDIDDPLLYHAVWNTDRTPFELIARSVRDLIRAK